MGKAYTRKNTHLQTAQSQPTSQSLQESIFYPKPLQIKIKNLPSLKKIKRIILTYKYINIKNEALCGTLPKRYYGFRTS